MKATISDAERRRRSDAVRRSWTPARRRSVTTPLSTNKVRAMYRSGLSQRKIAQALSVGEKVIRNHMRRHHINRRIFNPHDQWESNNRNWAGADGSNRAMHHRLSRRFGQPQRCEDCRTTDKHKWYDWHNMTGQLDDRADYRRLCRSCHRKCHKRMRNLRAGVAAANLQGNHGITK